MSSTYAMPNSTSAAAPSNRSGVVAAMAVLLVAGGFLRYAKATGALSILKLPAPLVRDLSDMDRGAVRPYAVRETIRLPAEVESELGTKWYMNWALEHPIAPAESWMRHATLFVTYFTGSADQLPHVPEECYVQGAFSESKNEEITFKLPTSRQEYPVRRLAFYPPGGRGATTFVYYNFLVNGDFYTDRNAVRVRMGKPTEKYLYHSKIELAFRQIDSREPSSGMDRMAERLLGQVNEALVKDHLPDTRAMERQAAAAPR